MKRLFIVSCILGLIFSTGGAAESDPPAPKKCAVFIANRADSDLNDQMPVFEDMITSQVTGLGLEVISREVVLSAVGDLRKQDKNVFFDAISGLLKQWKKEDLDAVLDDQTSALRLAQNLGADYLLFASFTGLDQEKRSVDAYGVNYENTMYTLRATYRILDGNTGGSLVSGMVEPTRTIQQTKHSQTSATGLMRELMAKASREIASGLSTQTAKIRDVKVADEEVEFQVGVSLNDVNFPGAVIDENGRVTITADQGTVQALAVPVELDGFVIGTTGSGGMSRFKAAPGLHRIRLVRDDLVPYERMINVHEGMQLTIAMQLNDEGLRRWRENIAVFNELIRKTKLNDAEVERIRAEAQRLRQSGYKVDVKIDTDEGLTIKKNQSLMNQD